MTNSFQTLHWPLLLTLVAAVGCEPQISKLPKDIREKAEEAQKEEEQQRKNAPPLEYGKNFISVVDNNRVVPRLEEMPVQELAKKSLGRIGSPAVPYLISALQSPDVNQRRKAAEVLAQIGPDAAAAVDPLARALSDPDLTVRRNAAIALGQIGPGAAPAVPRLMELLMREEPASPTTGL